MSDMTEETTTKTTVKLGDQVEYRDSRGFTKLALVVGTADSIHGEGGVSAPGTGRAHLSIFSPNGNRYFRSDVPEGEGARTWSALR